MASRFTEGEITSLVRRFFRRNGFAFLSTFPNGEKLYYTENGKQSNNKQPDSVVVKENLVIICEDKILFRALFADQNNSKSDFLKLTTFLNSEIDKALFRSKLSQKLKRDDLVLVGCLSSLASRSPVLKEFISEKLINLSILELADSRFRITLNIAEEYKKYFLLFELEIDL